MSRAARRPLAALALLAALGACASIAGPVETPEQRQARLRDQCTGAGFQPDSESFRLCLLLQQTNERLDRVERKLGFIQQDVATPPLFYPYRRGYWP